LPLILLGLPMSDSTPLGPKFFVLGTYVQADFTMPTWKARGINTLVEVPQGWDVDQWSFAAASNGLHMIRAPSSNLQSDLNNRWLLAWSQPDEPSNTNDGIVDYGHVACDPATLQQMVQPWRDAAAAANTYMPVWVNHIANHIVPAWATNSAIMHDYMQGPESDWLSSDAYQIQQRQPLLMSADGYTSTVQGVAADRQSAWSLDPLSNGPYQTHSKPVMSFIGTSAYGGSGMPVPTTGQFNAEAWSSVIHGATGVIYFPVKLSPWEWDATPPLLVDALTSFNHEITAINDIVIDTTNGGSRPHHIYRSANPRTAPTGDQLPYPFEATEISAPNGATYRIVLNLSDKSQVLDKPDWGLANATFAPFEVVKGFNFVTGTSSSDTLSGTLGPDTIKGYGGNDTISGGLGDDLISGGAGKDVMTGGGGNDAFTFDATPSNSNVKTIADFDPATDYIRLDHAIFTGFSGQNAMGTLLPAMFYAGAAAHDVNDRIVYNPATGALLYDADGTGQSRAAQIATLTSHLNVTATDFFVF
jgi:hypothetical protein